jgi:type II secretory pathway pseudopilin PulG
MACTLLLLLLSANIAGAIPLAAYRERIKSAVTALDSLQTQDEGASARARNDRTVSTINEVRKIVPAEETVEWNGTSLRVDNRWLDEALTKYEQIPPYNTVERRQFLAHITERLQALSDRLAEISVPGSSAQPSKDEEKARLASILQREEYRADADKESALSRLWDRFTKWLRSLFPKSEPVKANEQTSRAASGIAQIVILGLALAVIAFALWKLLPRFLRRERKARKSKKREARVVLGEKLEADQTASDLLAEAEALARQGEIRAAIRKGYIALLCELGDRKVISLAQHRTNRDYLRAVQDRRLLYTAMQPLTISFENHWYGYVPASETDWNDFRAHYQKAVTSEK